MAHVLCVFFHKKCNESGVDVVKSIYTYIHDHFVNVDVDEHDLENSL